MFCDLVGSTSLVAKLDAEDWRNLVNDYLDEASAAVTGLGGHVLKKLGDGLMALFGYPTAQENDAERALRAALAIQRARFPCVRAAASTPVQRLGVGDDLLPVAYYHLVFTLPAPIAPIAFQNKTVVYDLLFRAATETLIAIAANPKHLGARVGFTAVLHTWGSALTHHPHVHMIVPGGGLSSDGSRWIACKPRFFLPVRALSRLFRRLFLEGLAALHQAGRLAFFGDLVPLADRRALTAALAPVRRTEWVVYAKRPFAGPAAVLAYLSRYTHRVAISNSRLIASDDHSVTFRWKDYRARGEAPGSTSIKAMTLPVDEFIRRFLMHVLPNGFHRIRHYGLFASPRRAANIAHLRELLANADDASQPFGDAGMGVADAASADLADAFAIAQICPCCGGRMSVVETFARGAQPRSFKADAARIDTS